MNTFESPSGSLIAAMLLAALTAGCGGGGGGGDSGGQGSTPGGGGTTASAPTVTSTSPAATTPPASGVATNAKITAAFSATMDASTLDSPAANFTLSCAAGGSVTGAVSYAAASRVATFTSSAGLPANSTCTATITTGAKDTTGIALASNFAWTFTTAASADTTLPTVTLTVPADASAGASTNSQVAASFSEGMDAATITGASFTLSGPGATAVAGNVTYSASAKTATFAPTAALAAGTTYTATITTGATDLAGNPLAGASGSAAGNFAWSFTTGSAPDTTPPAVTLLSPVSLATGVCLNSAINATFSEAIDPGTITNSSFSVSAGGTPVSGTVFYDAASRVASFRAASALAASTAFTATVNTGVKDVAGNALASSMTWTFNTGTQACASAAVTALGSATSFGAFGGSAGITNQGTLSVINGDIGTTAASTLVTGFHDSTAACVYTQTPQNEGMVNGLIFTAPPPPAVGCATEGTAATLAIATQAAVDAQTAFDNLSPASLPGGTDPGAGELGGLTLTSGVYLAAGGSFQITGSDLVLDAQGNANAVWVFQMAGTLTVGAAGAPRSVVLVNGAQAKNVFWRVGGTATINAAGGGTMTGTIISSGSMAISASGNAGVATLNGRALALNASSVTMTNTAINVPAP